MSKDSSGLLFSDQDESVTADSGAETLVPAPTTGCLVTNHLNLMYLLAAGLLVPPSGFGDRYYSDTLQAFPGWLPLFVGHRPRAAPAPREALDASLAEAGQLLPVILEIDLEGLRGPVQAHGPCGWAERRLEQGVSERDRLLLLPAPLPTGRIRRIVFRSAEEKRKAEFEAEERRNVSLAGPKRATLKSWFPGTTDHAWPPPNGPGAREVAVESAQAAGGVLAVLQSMANTGELAVACCRAAFEPSSDPPAESILRDLPRWLRGAGGVAPAGTAPREPLRTGRELFWGVVKRLVVHRRDPDDFDFEDALVGFLRESAARMDEGAEARAGELLSTLEALGGGLGGGTVSEMLGQHKTPLARASILFLLREKTSELLELVEHYRQLDERDRLTAAILFGVRDGWLKMPTRLRGTPEFVKTVTHRMAAVAHRLDGSGFGLGEAPPRVRPLRELFGDPAPWSAKAEKAAAQLARTMKWNCVRTTVSLGRGAYEFRIERGAMHIDLPGEPKVVTGVDRDRFFEFLATERVDARVDAAVRKRLDA